MKLLHLADLHLGKRVYEFSMLEDQKYILQQILDMLEIEQIDGILFAGDIYDTSNPPAQAEKLFYRTVSELAENGKRCVVIIAGNHDNPERLSAASPLAHEQGIIILGMPDSFIDIHKYDEEYNRGRRFGLFHFVKR